MLYRPLAAPVSSSFNTSAKKKIAINEDLTNGVVPLQQWQELGRS